MTSFFRITGWLEGTSFLLLLGVAMPLKYLAGMPEAVKFTGWAHGLLFVAYCVSAFQQADQHSWPMRKLAAALVAAVLPFGPFVFHARLNSEPRPTAA